MSRLGVAIFSVFLISLGACSSKTATPTSSPTAVATTPASTTSRDFKADASGVVDDLGAGRFAAVEAKFDVTMKAKFPLDQFQNAWRTFQEENGTYKSHAVPAETFQGQIAVERVPITTVTSTGEVRIAYHPDGTIAGMYFLKAGAPPPSAGF